MQVIPFGPDTQYPVRMTEKAGYAKDKEPYCEGFVRVDFDRDVSSDSHFIVICSKLRSQDFEIDTRRTRSGCSITFKSWHHMWDVPDFEGILLVIPGQGMFDKVSDAVRQIQERVLRLEDVQRGLAQQVLDSEDRISVLHYEVCSLRTQVNQLIERVNMP